MRRARLAWLGILLAAGMALLGACGGDDKPDPRTPPANSSPAFKEGYAKGCPAGLESAAKQGSNWNNSKVDQRYGQDLEYKKGWDQGYFTCYDSQRSTSIFSGINPF
ncbi:MAG TPA: hypothetical protein VEK12_04280 [Alphaproteobacteria bacterium]|nr:hypothetical protein [Alphaproteobacteria bacterium]